MGILWIASNIEAENNVDLVSVYAWQYKISVLFFFIYQHYMVDGNAYNWHVETMFVLKHPQRWFVLPPW